MLTLNSIQRQVQANKTQPAFSSQQALTPAARQLASSHLQPGPNQDQFQHTQPSVHFGASMQPPGGNDPNNPWNSHNSHQSDFSSYWGPNNWDPRHTNQGGFVPEQPGPEEPEDVEMQDAGLDDFRNRADYKPYDPQNFDQRALPDKALKAMPKRERIANAQREFETMGDLAESRAKSRWGFDPKVRLVRNDKRINAERVAKEQAELLRQQHEQLTRLEKNVSQLFRQRGLPDPLASSTVHPATATYSSGSESNLEAQPDVAMFDAGLAELADFYNRADDRYDDSVMPGHHALPEGEPQAISRAGKSANAQNEYQPQGHITVSDAVKRWILGQGREQFPQVAARLQAQEEQDNIRRQREEAELLRYQSKQGKPLTGLEKQMTEMEKRVGGLCAKRGWSNPFAQDAHPATAAHPSGSEHDSQLTSEEYSDDEMFGAELADFYSRADYRHYDPNQPRRHALPEYELRKMPREERIANAKKEYDSNVQISVTQAKKRWLISERCKFPLTQERFRLEQEESDRRKEEQATLAKRQSKQRKQLTRLEKNVSQLFTQRGLPDPFASSATHPATAAPQDDAGTWIHTIGRDGSRRSHLVYANGTRSASVDDFGNELPPEN